MNARAHHERHEERHVLRLGPFEFARSHNERHEERQEERHVRLGDPAFLRQASQPDAAENEQVEVLVLDIVQELIRYPEATSVCVDLNQRLKSAKNSREKLDAFELHGILIDAADVLREANVAKGISGDGDGSLVQCLEKHADTLAKHLGHNFDEERVQQRKQQRQQRAAAEQRRQQMYRLLQSYSLLALKAGAGLLRLLLEDVLNFLVQGCFLVKYWDSFEGPMRVFTISSMLASLLCACAGPVKDLLEARAVQRKAREDGMESVLVLDDRAQQPAASGPRPYSQLEDAESPSAALVAAEEAAPGAMAMEPVLAGKSASRQQWGASTLYSGQLLDFMTDEKALHSKLCHRLLVACTVSYWASMAMIPLLFGGSIQGGKDSSVPLGLLPYFLFINGMSLQVELWVVAHLKHGAHLIMNCDEMLRMAFGGKRQALVTLFSAVLSLIGRYDTLSDVTFCIILSKTEPITYLHFTHTLGIRVPLPMELYHIALFSLIVGVFLFQGVPGILLVTCRTALPAAFKLNEFNFLLAFVDFEGAVVSYAYSEGEGGPQGAEEAPPSAEWVMPVPGSWRNEDPAESYENLGDEGSWDGGGPLAPRYRAAALPEPERHRPVRISL